MPAIFFDARYIRIDHHDGISRFSAGLFAELSKLTSVTAIVSDLRQLEKLPAGTKFVKLSDPTSILEPLISLKLNRLGASIVFSPMQTMGSFGRKFKLVLTLHDLIYYRHPAPPPSFNFAIKLLWRLYHLSYWPQRVLLNRADRVVTVSETTKKLMLQHRLTRKPIDVVYNATDSVSTDQIAGLRPNRQQNIVYMGSYMDYKNVELLIKSMAKLPGYNLQLLSRITDGRKAELANLISPTGGAVEFVNGVSDKAYEEYLLGAVALVHASRDEGFGIPLVEAMARGIPAVVSDIEIFREIGGDAAVYFDNESEDAFVSAIRSLDDQDAWLRRSKASIDQAGKFSWVSSAKRLQQTLNSL